MRANLPSFASLFVAVFAYATTACSAGDTDCVAGLPCQGDAQTPATGKIADIDAWLARGDYKQWSCESAPHAARGSSAHDKNRICSNDKLKNSTTGNFPIGAANVKELYDGDRVAGYAVMVKVTTNSDGASWYYYEKLPSGSVPANGPDDGSCTGCHSGAPRDYVFTQVK
jgi:hypothetical protein